VKIVANATDGIGCDLFLCHSGTDKSWVEELATRIEEEPGNGKKLRVFFDPWDVTPGQNVVNRLEKAVSKSRFVGVVLSPEMVVAEWPTMEWTIAVYEDPSGRRGKVMPFLLRNCDVPPSLRIRNWLDFRTPEKYERSYRKLVALLRGEPLPRGEQKLNQPLLSPVGAPESYSKPLHFADMVKEQLVSNLLPIKSYPELIWRSNTSVLFLRDVYSHMSAIYRAEMMPTFTLKENSLLSFWDPSDTNCPFRGLLSASIDARPDQTKTWLRDEEKRYWLVEMLNRSLRHHCKWLGLQSDEKRKRWYFTPDKGGDRIVPWDTGKRRSKRTVVRKYTKKASGEIFWAHLTVIPRFVSLGQNLFLRLEPTWTFTTDGYNLIPPEKRTSISTKWMFDEYNPSLFYHLRFWTFILARGMENIGINTGNSRLEVFGTPATTEMNYGVDGDSLNADKMYEVAETEIPPADHLLEEGESHN